MSSLYQLTNEYVQLKLMAQDPEADEMSAEIYADTFEGLDGEFEDKCESWMKVVQDIKGENAALKAEIARLTARLRVGEHSVDRMMETVKNSMISTGKTKFKTTLFSFGIQKNPPKVVIDDPDLIPAYFKIPQEPKIDTAAIKDLLKSGDENHELDGAAHLEQGESLRIR